MHIKYTFIACFSCRWLCRESHLETTPPPPTTTTAHSETKISTDLLSREGIKVDIVSAHVLHRLHVAQHLAPRVQAQHLENQDPRGWHVSTSQVVKQRPGLHIATYTYDEKLLSSSITRTHTAGPHDTNKHA